MTTSFSISDMIIHTINFNLYQPFELDPFFKVIKGITLATDIVNIQMLDKIYPVVTCCYFISHFNYVSKLYKNCCVKGHHDLDLGHRTT